MRKTKKGKIDISELNTPPEKHEYETAKFFANFGMDIYFIRPSDIKGTNTPDFRMCGKKWETKSPIGRSERTYEESFKKALRQSENIIFDLRRLDQINESKCLNRLKCMKRISKLKILLVITRDGRLLTLKGRFDRI